MLQPLQQRQSQLFLLGRLSNMLIFRIFILFSSFSIFNFVYAGQLSCSLRNVQCNQGEVLILRLKGSANSHAELPNQVNYQNLICCGGIDGLGNDCASSTKQTILRLSKETNAHAEEGSRSLYATTTCLSELPGGSVSVGYQDNSCSGYDTTVASISSTTNAHIGDGSVYTRKVCASAQEPQTLSFNISNNSVGFGALSLEKSRFATADGFGSDVEAVAHTLIASTNASNGYVISLIGTTLAFGDKEIPAIGCVNTLPVIATQQFGLKVFANGTGSAIAPYAEGGFAFCTSSQPSIIAKGVGDKVATTYSVEYLANMSSLTVAGEYGAILNYVITAEF